MGWSHGPPAKKEPPEEYKPETDPYQPEYERKDPYKSTAGHVTVEFFRQINAEASGTPSVNGVMVPRRPKNYVKPTLNTIAEQRRKRIQELEGSMSYLRKKLIEQQRMIK